MISKFKRKERALGVSEKHTYDIPLDKGSGRIFLTILTGLMVFLMLLSVSAAFILTDFASRWQTGLEGRWTIEIPVINKDGETLLLKDVETNAEKLVKSLNKFDAVINANILSNDEITELLSPWFDTEQDEAVEQSEILPIPILISLEMKQTGAKTARDITLEIEKISPNARLDQHENWMEELLRLTGTLRLIAMLVTLVISIAGILAVAGAMQSRMAEHKESVELLHLMGAGDGYICKQFQRHAFIISLQGALIGLLICGCFVYGLGIFLEGREETLLPAFTPTPLFWGAFTAVPVLIVLLCVFTTRWAVLHRLQNML